MRTRYFVTLVFVLFASGLGGSKAAEPRHAKPDRPSHAKLDRYLQEVDGRVPDDAPVRVIVTAHPEERLRAAV